jgi:AAA family ATP:ADP antiporter
MSRLLVTVRPGERRDTAAAFLTLFGFLASHSVLETARDALFLAKIPASRLPWMYTAIAVASLALIRTGGGSKWLAGRTAVSTWLLIVSAVTFGLWWAIDAVGAAGIYALYIWAGVLTSLVLVPFWVLVGETFSITQAKRLYGVIGGGSVLGAVAGSAAASGLARMVRPASLLFIAAASFAVTALMPRLFRPSASLAGENSTAQQPKPSLLDDARFSARQPYARVVATVVILSTCALTVADFVFKSSVASAIPAAKLGAFLATVSLILNLLSLGAQVFLVGWLIRRFDLTAALAVLPALLMVGGVGVLVGGALPAALLVKGADGSLRHSLHRTAMELLFVPLPEESRRRMKSFVDVMGQRAGQALASVGILIATAMGAHVAALGGALMLLSATWAISALRIRRHYLDIFRRHLHGGQRSLREFPELDVASLETLVATLDSSNDDEVLAALTVLSREGKTRLVPALILHHPSEAVVERALQLLTEEGRTRIVDVVDRLIDHPSPRIRAAAIASRSTLEPDVALLQERLRGEASPDVRATIVVHLIAAGAIPEAEAGERLETLLREGSPATRMALASAVGLGDRTALAGILVPLSRAPELEVRLAAAAAMTHIRSPAFLSALLDLVADERTRPAARDALVGYGDEGFACVEAALRDSALPQRVRAQLPWLLQSFDAQNAADALLSHLPEERDGMVRYRSIRALEWLVSRDTSLRLDQGKLDAAVDVTVRRAYQSLDQRVILLEGAAALPERATPGHDLLVKMLRDKEENAIGRIFRLVGLLHPTESFDEILRGFASKRGRDRASSIELVGNLLKPPLRGAVLGLLDDAPDAERLAAGGRYVKPARIGYDALLEQMLESPSAGLRELTVFHVGELKLVQFRPVIERLGGDGARSEIARTLEILSREEKAAC